MYYVMQALEHTLVCAVGPTSEVLVLDRAVFHSPRNNSFVLNYFGLHC